MALKGQTTIELTNVKTGEKRTYKDTNMVTNGLNKILQVLPQETETTISRLYSNSNGTRTSAFDDSTGIDRIVRMATGGLVLLDSQMEENANNFIVPSEINTVGCGTTIPYSGSNTMAGSYNEEESGAIENGWKHVWDFPTTHGNGTFSCACLTTREGGISANGTFPYDEQYRLTNSKGIGNNTISTPQYESLSYRTIAPISLPTSRSIADILYIDYSKECFYISKDEKIYNHNFYQTTLKDGFIYKKYLELDVIKLPFTKVSLFEKETGSLNNLKVIETIKIDMPSELSAEVDTLLSSGSYILGGFSSDENYLYISFGKSDGHYCCAVDDYIHIWKINMNTFTSEYIKMQNKTNFAIVLGNEMGLDSVKVFNNTLIGASYGSPCNLFLIDINNPTNYKTILKPNGEEVKLSHSTWSSPIQSGVYIKNKLYTKNYIIDFKTGVLKYRASYSYDIINDVKDPSGPCYNPLYIQNSNGLIAYIERYKQNSTYYLKFHINTLQDIMLTINNLDSPVTKTENETMKITYTLTAVND